MSKFENFTVGIISSAPAALDRQGRVVCNHSIGRLLDALRDGVPHAKLCVAILPEPQKHMKHVLNFPPEDVVALPPLGSVIRSQVYYFQTRRILRRFARSVDVLFMRLPFPLPMALVNLGKPKLLHVVGNTHAVVSESSDYKGLVKKLAIRYAMHSNNTSKRLVKEPMTRAATNGGEMWEVLGCRDGRVVVSSCIYAREMQPRQNLALNDPPRLLFVGYLRPEKGITTLLEAFEQLRRKRPLKLTLAGGSDKALTISEAEIYERIRNHPFAADIEMTGMVDFGEPLFEMYRSHDVFVLPSLSEGTPRTLVEARALGCPAVATRAGGIPASVQDGKTGLLVDPGDAAALAGAIDRILTDEPLRLSLIRNGLDASNEQTLEYFAGQLVDELKILARGREHAPDISPAALTK